jgi:hypothetical protein
VPPAAEGNHWQSQLAPGQLTAAAMPASMAAGIPREDLLVAHFQTLAELGLAQDAFAARDGGARN